MEFEHQTVQYLLQAQLFQRLCSRRIERKGGLNVINLRRRSNAVDSACDSRRV